MQQNTTFWRFIVRNFTWDDLYAVQALINVVAEDEQDPYYYTLEWLYFMLSQPGVDAEHNCFVVQLANDRIVGYSRVEAGNNPARQAVFAGVHSEFRGIGIGRWLITVNDFNLLSRQPAVTPLTVVRQTSPHNPDAVRLLTCKGYIQTTTGEDNRVLWERQFCY